MRIRGAASLPVRTTRRPCFANVRARTPRLRSSSAARVRHARERHVRRLRVSRASDTSCTSNTGSVRPGRGGGFSAVAAEEADRHEGKCRRIQRADAVCRRCGTRTAAQQKFTRVSFWRKPTRCRSTQARIAVCDRIVQAKISRKTVAAKAFEERARRRAVRRLRGHARAQRLRTT